MNAELDTYSRRGDVAEMLQRIGSALASEALALLAAAVTSMDTDGVVPTEVLPRGEAARYLPRLVDAGVLRSFPAGAGRPAVVQVVHHYLFVEPSEPPSFRVYFIENGPGGDIKIGRSRRLHGRVADLQTSTPQLLRVLAHVNGGATMEGILRDRFRPHRIHGEWFRRNDELMSLIAEAASP